MLTNTQLWQVISVEGDKLTYKAKTATGRLHDQFTIDKPAGQAKIITEDLANVQQEGVGGVVPGTLSLSLAAAPIARRVHAGRRQGLRGGRRPRRSRPRRPTPRSSSSTRRPPTPGKLVNGTFALAQPIQAAVGGAFGPVSGSPLALHSYSGPIANDPVDDPLQAVHRRQRGAAHGRLQQVAHAHAVDDAP